ncbi:hypothetical protein [Cytobacillus dafuensis]|uniref:Uncharacterized protein n=1 Tax=Cytobacillus dafuensis TaxID=1742359 RepID=A0A5B8Z5G8_CYTDA|nr:hypothetical protein [Cytobacillus dafuensis]QED48201.1 hypothetical protein FSZ17_13670 [Cytobacillus dafuensis]
MAKSNAKKIREKSVREGKRNPEANRSPFIFADMRTRKTKTKKDYLYCKKYKNQSLNQSSDGSYFLPLLSFKVFFTI